ncbi:MULTISPECIES: aspartate/glutamate racemase family protein [unclassified Campylobacter]|uniref:aspartate/glutamate racemase family protein n=1 Tax=unclassified Campylobacter TaxID=2593542 RepID=UPI0022E9B2AF|nr:MULTISPECIES: amino acid racemase [unclassified Campylobacter]MDA3055116.1 amino acid racemase [Campylobacter sp. VBCF_07 NA4]MDA3070885.1 amino acid racemase [Campylobacter sp. VBCF_08 NA3]WBR54026.1 amino acid racemase [Campylobacter sp. VBCF_01 NA2]
MRRVGVIGGMGPLASADLYLKTIELTGARSDQENIPLLIDSYPQIEDRTACIFGEGEDPTPKLIESATRLKNAGCEAFVMVCNTAHYFALRVLEAVDLPLIHIAKNAVSTIQTRYPNAKKIAVLATSGTKKARVYDEHLENAGLISVELGEENQAKLMDCIYKGVKAGKTAEYVELFKSVLDSIDADVYIAGCTEIPLFLPLIETDKVFLDATLELARAIVEFARS